MDSVGMFLEALKGTPGHVCDTCGRSYKYKHGLVQHRKFECGKAPMFQCPYCPFRAKQKFNLKSHVVVKHNDRLSEGSNV
ncbi:longitudinals lacking protein, isoforms A/B/D/L-like [Homalodisca vitripennis]|uniref:longitudinals lacking protein, isoforms A/B/D/L-like n=1 Tax=Homalodisca vitripennis TaxID=197043 RepID=UPI001EEC0397|nr:longitudinals lacking protein, isoforms A/B/D/L-like [Homalodisca vitripennis]